MQEIFQVPEKLKAMLDLLDRQREALEKAERAVRELNSGEKHKFVDAKLTTAMRDISNAYATLGREYRNWLGHIKTNLDSLSLGRKMQVMVQFVQDLPLGNRREIYQILSTLESKRPDCITLEVTDQFAQPEEHRHDDE
jgi:hypothetical protein